MSIFASKTIATFPLTTFPDSKAEMAARLPHTHIRPQAKKLLKNQGSPAEQGNGRPQHSSPSAAQAQPALLQG